MGWPKRIKKIITVVGIGSGIAGDMGLPIAGDISKIIKAMKKDPKIDMAVAHEITSTQLDGAIKVIAFQITEIETLKTRVAALERLVEKGSRK